MATVTLSYYVQRGLIRPSVLSDKVEAVILDHGEQELLGLTLVSDTTIEPDAADTVPGTTLVRTLVLEQTAQGALDIPGEANLIAATAHLYEGVLAACLPGIVSAGEPVVS